MAAVIIRKKDLDRLGKEIFKEVYELLDTEELTNQYKDLDYAKRVFFNSLCTHYLGDYPKFKTREHIIVESFLKSKLELEEDINLDKEKKV